MEYVPKVKYLVPACAACSRRRREEIPTAWERLDAVEDDDSTVGS
jgi:hypothetical protein